MTDGPTSDLRHCTLHLLTLTIDLHLVHSLTLGTKLSTVTKPREEKGERKVERYVKQLQKLRGLSGKQ